MKQHTVDIYEQVTGDKCPGNQIAYSEWYMRYVEWLEKQVSTFYGTNKS